jgi:hypothetical protein
LIAHGRESEVTDAGECKPLEGIPVFPADGSSVALRSFDETLTFDTHFKCGSLKSAEQVQDWITYEPILSSDVQPCRLAFMNMRCGYGPMSTPTAIVAGSISLSGALLEITTFLQITSFPPAPSERVSPTVSILLVAVP